MDNNSNHKLGLEKAIKDLSNGQLHDINHQAHLSRLLEAGKTLTDQSCRIIDKLGKTSTDLDRLKSELNELEYQKDAIFYFALKEINGDEFAYLSNLVYHYTEMTKQ